MRAQAMAAKWAWPNPVPLPPACPSYLDIDRNPRSHSGSASVRKPVMAFLPHNGEPTVSFWTRWIKLCSGNLTPRRRFGGDKTAKRRTNCKLLLEPLEDRIVPAFGLAALHLGSAAGPTNYDYTAGNTVIPTGSVDSGNYYDLVVTDSLGVAHTVVPRTASNPFTLANASYTIQSSDPVSTGTAWTFRLDEYANATTTTVLNTASLSFDVAAVKIYSSSSLTTLQNYFDAGATAYLTVAGLTPGSPWQVTWLAPGGSTVAALTARGLPSSNSSGALPQNTGTYRGGLHCADLERQGLVPLHQQDQHHDSIHRFGQQRWLGAARSGPVRQGSD
jgi:hypothetical protein